MLQMLSYYIFAKLLPSLTNGNDFLTEECCPKALLNKQFLRWVSFVKFLMSCTNADEVRSIQIGIKFRWDFW